MPEDTRVQQQVHMHIWMEADIIMVIVSDPPQGCQGEARFAWMQILDIKNQKIHHWRRVVSARGMSNQETRLRMCRAPSWSGVSICTGATPPAREFSYPRQRLRTGWSRSGQTTGTSTPSTPTREACGITPPTAPLIMRHRQLPMAWFTTSQTTPTGTHSTKLAARWRKYLGPPARPEPRLLAPI
jgi:hypothetical protein